MYSKPLPQDLIKAVRMILEGNQSKPTKEGYYQLNLYRQPVGWREHETKSRSGNPVRHSIATWRFNAKSPDHAVELAQKKHDAIPPEKRAEMHPSIQNLDLAALKKAGHLGVRRHGPPADVYGYHYDREEK